MGPRVNPAAGPPHCSAPSRRRGHLAGAFLLSGHSDVVDAVSDLMGKAPLTPLADHLNRFVRLDHEVLLGADHYSGLAIAVTVLTELDRARAAYRGKALV